MKRSTKFILIGAGLALAGYTLYRVTKAVKKSKVDVSDVAPPFRDLVKELEYKNVPYFIDKSDTGQYVKFLFSTKGGFDEDNMMIVSIGLGCEKSKFDKDERIIKGCILEDDVQQQKNEKIGWEYDRFMGRKRPISHSVYYGNLTISNVILPNNKEFNEGLIKSFKNPKRALKKIIPYYIEYIAKQSDWKAPKNWQENIHNLTIYDAKKEQPQLLK